MADAAAKREARRRRILQNSENRMNRLLGRASSDQNEPDQVCNEEPQRDSQSENPDLSMETRTPEQASVTTEEMPSRVSDSETLDGATNGEPQSHTASVRQRVHRTAPAETWPAEEVPAAGRVPTCSVAQTEKARNGVSRTKVQPDSATMDPLRLLDLMRCGGCLLAAFLTRWALSFGLGLVFFEFVLVPFLMLEGSLFYFQTTYMKDLQLPHKSSMMAYALLLSGVKQEIITKYNSIMGYISAVTEDFALFLFSFLLCHAVMA